MGNLIDVDVLLSDCKKAADTLENMCSTILDKIGHGESEESAFGALAYFRQQERMYRWEIPNLITSADKASNEDFDKIRHGEWLDFAGDFSTAECNRCGELYEVSPEDTPRKEMFDAFGQFYKYCPHCGAKMGGTKKPRKSSGEDS